jgi:hypothetical protein
MAHFCLLGDDDDFFYLMFIHTRPETPFYRKFIIIINVCKCFFFNQNNNDGHIFYGFETKSCTLYFMIWFLLLLSSKELKFTKFLVKSFCLLPFATESLICNTPYITSDITTEIGRFVFNRWGADGNEDVITEFGYKLKWFCGVIDRSGEIKKSPLGLCRKMWEKSWIWSKD